MSRKFWEKSSIYNEKILTRLGVHASRNSSFSIQSIISQQYDGSVLMSGVPLSGRPDGSVVSVVRSLFWEFFHESLSVLHQFWRENLIYFLEIQKNIRKFVKNYRWKGYEYFSRKIQIIFFENSKKMAKLGKKMDQMNKKILENPLVMFVIKQKESLLLFCDDLPQSLMCLCLIVFHFFFNNFGYDDVRDLWMF